MKSISVFLFSALILFASCSQAQKKAKKSNSNLSGLSKAYFASGCFWCVEEIFESVKGVKEVVSGYAGGKTLNPTYEEVGSGRTGHAEAVEVYYDPKIVDFKTLVKVFYGSQDPTTIGQSPDFGPQYRSIIFYSNPEEKAVAEAAKAEVGTSGIYKKPIVTEITKLEKFYDAEDYHQDYVKNNPTQSYVVGVSIPRLQRFKKKFPGLLK
ncbi:MAG TPA: peptide-methionine (S)-S-oxide reductase MsrA [Leadbetterella sp.]|nr:peptide-methionine (S)-S-oxide reductase MsrA [Leadbetterella sp.]